MESATDLHMHSVVSDGDLNPVQLLQVAAAHGLRHVSITDHDALGAYYYQSCAVLAEAQRLGLELWIGVELDADFEGQEVHVLGYQLSLDASPLSEHLDRVRLARLERAQREFEIVNRLLGPGVVTHAEIFVPERVTFMRPHFIHPLIERKKFAHYKEANAWYKANVRANVVVPKPSLRDAIAMIRGAGGWACLAHAAYYERDGRPMVERLGEFKAMGLTGVETEYPYHLCSPREFTQQDVEQFAARLGQAAEIHGLRTTRGSDCHTINDFDRMYGPPRRT
ncbi:MAG: PHP domain-containing protein [Vicinamibacteria bacterium]|jgi:hypothetical protein|nr:PHP domain-containing protein [Vicinamibacteria bacterium]